jgi:hypothetical protein
MISLREIIAFAKQTQFGQGIISHSSFCSSGFALTVLDGEISYTLREAQIIIESWRRHYNAIRPHESLPTNHLHPGNSCQHRRVARCAASTGSAGHATARATANLTFHLDHSARGPTNARLYS